MGTVIVWFVLSLILGVVGSDRKIGFFGAFAASLFLSPLIGFIITLASKTKDAEQYEMQLLNAQRNQVASLKNIQDQQLAGNTNKKSVSEELESLQKMKEAGNLTEDEYQQAKAKVISAA